VTLLASPGSGSFIADDSQYLEYITVSENNSMYDSRNNCNAVVKTDKNEIIIGSVNTVIPDSIEIIGDRAFYKTSITEVTIPTSVKLIGESAFSTCYKLSKVSILGAPSLGEGWYDTSFFSYCTSLTEVSLGSITKISRMTFSGCNALETIEIPSTVTSIDDRAFEGCVKLKTITCKALNAPSTNMYAFGSSTSSFTGISTVGENILYVPNGATGYDKDAWLDPLQNAEKCGFRLSTTL
jgi:hypothetical protein